VRDAEIAQQQQTHWQELSSTVLSVTAHYDRLVLVNNSFPVVREGDTVLAQITRSWSLRKTNVQNTPCYFAEQYMLF